MKDLAQSMDSRSIDVSVQAGRTSYIAPSAFFSGIRTPVLMKTVVRRLFRKDILRLGYPFRWRPLVIHVVGLSR